MTTDRLGQSSRMAGKPPLAARLLGFESAWMTNTWNDNVNIPIETTNITYFQNLSMVLGKHKKYVK